MATLTVINPDLNGEAVVPVAAAGGGDVFAADSGSAEYLVHLRNAHTAPWTVTFDDPTSVTPVDATTFNPDIGVVVTNATERIIRVPSSRFRNATTGMISMTYTGVTALTLNVFKAR